MWNFIHKKFYIDFLLERLDWLEQDGIFLFQSSCVCFVILEVIFESFYLKFLPANSFLVVF